MYELIQAHPSAAAIYGAECVAVGPRLRSATSRRCVRSTPRPSRPPCAGERTAPGSEDALASDGAAAGEARGEGPAADTRVDGTTLSRIVEGVSALPAGMRIHDKLKSIVTAKLKAFRERSLLDWSLAEAAVLR